MAIMFSTKQLFSICIILSFMLSFSYGRSLNPAFRIKAVNLGGWLVTEGWIKPSLFDGIPNKDFLDGTQLQFKSVTVGKYLCAENGGGTIVVANRTSASGWETFKLWRINETNFHFRVFNKQFIGLDTNGNGIDIVAESNTPGSSETFEIVRNSNDLSRVRIKAPNGFFLQAKTEELVTADYEGATSWGDDDPSVFEMTIAGRMQGEFQVTNGYGPQKAPQVMRKHWSTYIVEDDFKFIAGNGLNAVRIPVGWWMASDPAPPAPYVGGSLRALDNAFTWARYAFFPFPSDITISVSTSQDLTIMGGPVHNTPKKYGLRIIIDLHAAPGSQNGFEHSSSRDGSQEWGLTDDNIQQTVAVIDFLTARYARSPSLYAVELINEPLSPGASLESVNKYYKAGYDAVRKHSSTAYVVMSNRLGPMDPRELFPLASGLRGSVIDVHYYNLFSDIFNSMTVQQNIDFVYTNRSAQLNQITTSNGPLTFVGEWVAEWQVSGASKEDLRRFAKAQLEVYGRATFGWAYWTLKNVNNHWSLEWMIKNGYIKL
ncbi:Mannan endo-1,4-beta-mannosidase [Citrus sinensis]|nr:Mannan endo-1,4-beta-mannosidase [Citrus sinensis]